VRLPSGRGDEDQSGTGTRRRVGHFHDTIDAGAAGRGEFDRGEMNHDMGLVGQPLQRRTAQRCVNHVDTAVQVLMGMPCDAADRVAGSQQLPGKSPPERCRHAGYQDAHGCPPPHRLPENYRPAGGVSRNI
jgi:hypothetical protein